MAHSPAQGLCAWKKNCAALNAADYGGIGRRAQRRKGDAQSVQLGAARTGVELFLNEGITFEAKFVCAFETLVARRGRQRRLVRHTLSARLRGFRGEGQCTCETGGG